MSVFVDSSAFVALLSSNDVNHGRARQTWTELLTIKEPRVTSSYVVLETWALLQSRIGLNAVRSLQEDFLPLVRIEWIDEATHGAAVSAVLASGRRDLSLADCASFAVMRELGIRDAFTFDHHFADQGFECRP